MKNNILTMAALAVSALVFTGCDKDDDDDPAPAENKNINVSITGLKDLGPAAQYEGWLIVNGSAVSAGKFNVNQNGTLSQTSFSLSKSNVESASAYVLTIEPNPDPSPNADSRHILAGMFSGSTATLSVGATEALGTDFTGAMGKYLLATPTTSSMSDELSGVWFIDNSTGMMQPGLNLPGLPGGWVYEGWAVVNGKAVSTGRFTDENGADQAAPYSGPMPGPAFPGEDLIDNAPAGLSFPTNLQGQEIVITVEPNPDNSAEPFFLKPLAGMVPGGAVTMVPYALDNTAAANNPTGTVTR